ncbi:hypothetical protein BDZ94DRAFT_1049304 [Collybia nuda]|uniref:DUF6534 domain-containing protein n=1 Tax=Collybia nuda TaxID=64659 RepID=A0A9P6CBA2_9AGAR|nr:hypothetical protein BDZ94DRAFT_1049304 [Collybia nuda]
MKSTDSITNRLIAHIIGNGILTTIVDILVLAFALGDSIIYVNSVLASLNSRRSMTRVGEITRISFVLPLSRPDMSTPRELESTRSSDLQPCEDRSNYAVSSES